VHGPDRLKVLSPCAVFQGEVKEAPVKNPDGDVSFQVSPDPGYAGMLNAQNRREGGLHIEIVPRDQAGCTPGQPIHVGDVPDLGTCSGRDVAAPAVGAHVRIIGPWVLDRNNNWYEICGSLSDSSLRPLLLLARSVVRKPTRLMTGRPLSPCLAASVPLERRQVSTSQRSRTRVRLSIS
jgi:hypothetical protein